jgi:hypothetical protein
MALSLATQVALVTSRGEVIGVSHGDRFRHKGCVLQWPSTPERCAAV